MQLDEREVVKKFAIRQAKVLHLQKSSTGNV